ncbi:hypothetical protein, partial [Pseudaminobacter soli (ex Li et al. 2025)]|uniref:hypothetical protein n=1 Tax=Pseudaminobacter soli (ex Li et al. 2025) TaxID=1295366 RepID=UPI001AEC9070
ITWCREGGRRQSFATRFATWLSSSLPVLFDIVKRRFVRTSLVEHDPKKLQDFLDKDHAGRMICRGETLNLPHMMGLPNRALEPISRSWSFCADGV